MPQRKPSTSKMVASFLVRCCSRCMLTCPAAQTVARIIKLKLMIMFEAACEARAFLEEPKVIANLAYILSFCSSSCVL